MAVATKLAVAASDRAQLTTWVRAATTRRSLAERARIILLSAEGLSAAAIAERLGIVRLTVYKWRQRYVRDGVAGLRDRPRPGQPRHLSPEKARDILRWTVERIPHEATHWSLRLMAKHAGEPVARGAGVEGRGPAAASTEDLHESSCDGGQITPAELSALAERCGAQIASCFRR